MARRLLQRVKTRRLTPRPDKKKRRLFFQGEELHSTAEYIDLPCRSTYTNLPCTHRFYLVRRARFDLLLGIDMPHMGNGEGETHGRQIGDGLCG